MIVFVSLFCGVVPPPRPIHSPPLSCSSIAHDNGVTHVIAGIACPSQSRTAVLSSSTVCCVPRANSLRPQSSVKLRPLMKQSASLGNSLLQETLSIKIERISFPKPLMLSIHIERTFWIFQAPALRAGDAVRSLLGEDLPGGVDSSLG